MIQRWQDVQTVVSKRAQFEGCNIRTWVGFKHLMYLMEEAASSTFGIWTWNLAVCMTNTACVSSLFTRPLESIAPSTSMISPR